MGKVPYKKDSTMVSINDESNIIENPLEVIQVPSNSDIFMSGWFSRERYHLEVNDALNFIKSLPDKSVDLIITDPAYSGMNQMLKLGRGKIIGEYKNKGDGNNWFEEFHDSKENYFHLLTEFYRVMKDNRHVYIMFDSYSLLSLGHLVREIFNVKNVIVWDKINIGMGHYFRRRHEFILFASKGKRNLNSKSIPDVWRIKRIVRASYPTQKPTEVFEMMIRSSADRDFVVCDPFLGSGSSAIAALRCGCKFIGCDISEISVRIASDRVQEYLTNGDDVLQKDRLADNDDKLLNGVLNQCHL